MGAATWVTAGVVVIAPLAVGGVHRPVLIALMVTTLVGFGLFVAGAIFQGRPPRVGLAVLLPMALLVVPALQSIPLRTHFRAALDQRGSALIADSLVGPPTFAPLSLDPPSTHADLGKAAVALAVFVLAFHSSSGQRRRHLFIRAVAAAGVCAVLIGMGHRVFGITKIYGVVPSTVRTLISGPFVNSNHTAELLELATFACLACASHRLTPLSRVAWLTGAVLCLGGTVATLSRGGVLGLAVATLAFAVMRSQARGRDEERGTRWSALAWFTIVSGLTVVAVGSFGAREVIERFEAASPGTDIRFKLWRDSLRVLAAHPFGIGRGAFERVFPVYRTLKTSFPLRFSFVENEPLQLLLDSGWLFYALLVAATGCAVWFIVRFRRRDKPEALLLAGLIAVFVHSLFDFGLETLGVAVPFMAILGATLGRMKQGVEMQPSRVGPLAIGAALVGLIVGTATVARASSANFDALIEASRDVGTRRVLLRRAQAEHPTDYLYVLAYARTEPLKPDASRVSPRLHALNRALTLCPNCETVHAEVARNLWALNLRRQSLMEWRLAVQLQPSMLSEAFKMLFTSGATPTEIAAVVGPDPALMVEVAHMLGRVGHHADAIKVLDQAEALGGASRETLVTRTQLQIQLGQTDAAAASLAKARSAGIRDPRLSAIEAQQILTMKGADGADEALAVLDLAATSYPTDLPIQRARVELVATYAKWRAVDRALEGFKQAIYRNQGSAVDAHVTAARIYAKLSRWNESISEYRMAILDAPNDVALWMEFGGTADRAGLLPTARDAYYQAARLSPGDASIANALHALESRSASAHILGHLGSPLPGEN